MIRMFIWHRVRNYPRWRKGYDTFWRTQPPKGIKPAGVYQDVTNPNAVTVVHDVKTAGRARSFARSKRLRTAMRGAGVREPVAVWFAKPTRKTPKPAKRRRSRRKRRR